MKPDHIYQKLDLGLDLAKMDFEDGLITREELSEKAQKYFGEANEQLRLMPLEDAKKYHKTKEWIDILEYQTIQYLNWAKN